MNSRFLTYSFAATCGLYLLVYLLYYEAMVSFNVFLVSFSFVFFYYMILLLASGFKRVRNEVFVITMIFILVYTAIFNWLYVDHRGDNFEFTGSDSTTYHYYAIEATHFSYFEGIVNFVEDSKYGYDDSGMIAYLSFLYRIVNDSLFPRLINVLIGLFTAFLLYRIARQILLEKTAFLIAIIYGSASYTIYYISSGLKETIFTLFVVMAFYFYRRYVKSLNMTNLVPMALSIIPIFLFRIPVAVILILAIGLAELFNRKGSTVVWVLGGMFLLVVINYATPYIEILIRYAGATNLNIDEQETVSRGPLLTLIVIASGIFGPFPTIPATPGHEADSLWAASLILKSMLSIYFVYGCVLVMKSKNAFLMAASIFSILTILSLISIDNTFKVRYVMPYLPLFFLVAGYGFDTIVNSTGYSFMKKTIAPVNILILFLLLFWNILRV